MAEDYGADAFEDASPSPAKPAGSAASAAPLESKRTDPSKSAAKASRAGAEEAHHYRLAIDMRAIKLDEAALSVHSALRAVFDFSRVSHGNAAAHGLAVFLRCSRWFAARRVKCFCSALQLLVPAVSHQFGGHEQANDRCRFWAPDRAAGMRV